jgi:hypothetical protein
MKKPQRRDGRTLRRDLKWGKSKFRPWKLGVRNGEKNSGGCPFYWKE